MTPPPVALKPPPEGWRWLEYKEEVQIGDMTVDEFGVKSCAWYKGRKVERESVGTIARKIAQ